MPTIREIATALEAWAPPASSLEYDNVGLQVGYPDRNVARALVALDLTPAVVDEAIETQADLIITHHPLLFKPPKQLIGTDLIGSMVLRLAEKGIGYYAIHTNLDAAQGGVSFGLADRLGLEDIRFLEPSAGDLFKLVVFVPESHAETVRTAATEEGAGHIGNYKGCSFETPGTGHFQPTEDATPHIGQAGGASESVDEIRLEMEVMRWDVGHVLEGIRSVHPYEEVAYDVYPMDKPATRFGMGAIGTLSSRQRLDAFLSQVAQTLDASSIRFSGDLVMTVERVAVCGGSGSSLISAARAQKADVFVTADVTYHRFFEAIRPDGSHAMAIVDVGHYESEAHTETMIVDYLSQRFPDVVLQRTTVRTSEMRTFAPGPS
ncbi:MAG: Nif3-like dinuclear metal center hexameric protein [Rubricoccaceae bacterium]|nr:Nif3-like dinuclear metal center hexameric protein [Rubricoccaceae bacterium]